MGGFEAVETAPGGGEADGAPAVDTVGNGDQAGGNGGGGTARGTAGVVGGVVRVHGGPFDGVVVCYVCFH